jgi:hypothetical protein
MVAGSVGTTFEGRSRPKMFFVSNDGQARISALPPYPCQHVIIQPQCDVKVLRRRSFARSLNASLSRLSGRSISITVDSKAVRLK